MDRHKGTNRQTDRQIGKQTDRQTDKQTNRQAGFSNSHSLAHASTQTQGKAEEGLSSTRERWSLTEHKLTKSRLVGAREGGVHVILASPTLCSLVLHTLGSLC